MQEKNIEIPYSEYQVMRFLEKLMEMSQDENFLKTCLSNIIPMEEAKIVRSEVVLSPKQPFIKAYVEQNGLMREIDIKVVDWMFKERNETEVSHQA